MNPGALADVAQLLNQAGYEIQSCQVGYLCLTDPTCIWPPLLEFINTAWIIISVITAFLLAGWGVVMVRGAMYSASDIAKNLRTLVLIFGTLSAAIPAVNVLGAGKYVVSRCDVIKISQAQVQELLDMRNATLTQPMYEHTTITDSAYDDDDNNANYDDDNANNEFNF